MLTRAARIFSRRSLLLGIGAGAGIAVARGWQRGSASVPALLVPPAGAAPVLDDASELSATPVLRHATITGDPEAATAAIRTELAGAAGAPVAASAARHSMGGQSLARGGIALTLDQNWIAADPASGTYRVAAGTRWRQVIAALDGIGFSPAVMQSNNDFGVAATFAVNAHGWPVPYAGCGATVRSLRMVLADGRQIACSRAENAETFAAAMGGYGLFGVISELELDMVPNQRLLPRFETMPAAAIGAHFREVLRADPAVSMAYGRLDVSHGRFFDEAMLITYRPTADQENLPPAPGSGFVSKAARHVFRAQVENEIVKRGRWWTETALGPRIATETTRNALLNEPVITLDDRDPARTDILHEYFVPPEALERFLGACREIIPQSFQQLLNVTLRFVRADRESWLAYAPDDRIAAVMLFSQEKTARAEADMARITRLLIDAALAAGGSYYLPYRLHATRDQFAAAYPRARAFAALKRRLDPEARFSNAFWTTYLEAS